MALFTPGQFKRALQDKVKNTPDPVDDESDQPIPIKKTQPDNFIPRASDYHAKPTTTTPGGYSTAQLPKDSPLNKSVHERMKAFVKDQYTGK